VHLPELNRVVLCLRARSAGTRGVAEARLVGPGLELERREAQHAVAALVERFDIEPYSDFSAK